LTTKPPARSGAAGKEQQEDGPWSNRSALKRQAAADPARAEALRLTIFPEEREVDRATVDVFEAKRAIARPR
jgi:hypothetical protein